MVTETADVVIARKLTYCTEIRPYNKQKISATAANFLAIVQTCSPRGVLTKLDENVAAFSSYKKKMIFQKQINIT